MRVYICPSSLEASSLHHHSSVELLCKGNGIFSSPMSINNVTEKGNFDPPSSLPGSLFDFETAFVP